MSAAAYTRRFTSYARCRAMKPDEVPQGWAPDFMAWVHAQWRQWRAETGHTGAIGDAEQAAFDDWLEQRPQP